MTRMKWQQEHIDFLRQNVEGSTSKELTYKFNKHFTTNLNISQVKTQVFKRGMKFNNYPQRIKKGEVICKCYEVGDKSVDGLGNVIIKYTDEYKNTRKNWKMYHHFLWEKHNGEIPKNHIVIFLNGDKRDFRLENLKLVHRSIHQMMILNQLLFEDKELTNTSINIAKLLKLQTENTVRKRKKGSV